MHIAADATGLIGAWQTFTFDAVEQELYPVILQPMFLQILRSLNVSLPERDLHCLQACDEPDPQLKHRAAEADPTNANVAIAKNTIKSVFFTISLQG